ncbi:MAG: response regulator transcription factor [Spirochaetales bacterium]|uniref:Response regulator transcription factor n=1 Tax=Candidatus Thalassospirochaeta sargassi TaxID=3119039 RepID=A0AAJ1IFL6_9SPIO|nr:response regulator transcription factor [Spirochaetales bacterium]
MSKILIVEDISEMSELISIYLKKAGMETLVCDTAEGALIELQKLVEDDSFDLIILDINLPGMDGFQFLETMRHEFHTPVLILSARGTDDDMVRGLSLGADEYVTKPFSPRVLTARVEAMLRRSAAPAAGQQTVISFGEFRLNTDNYILKRGDMRVLMPNKELEILILLAQAEGAPITPDDIYKKVWGDSFGDITTVAVHIQRIRKKIEADPSSPSFLKTSHGQGYYFDNSGENRS